MSGEDRVRAGYHAHRTVVERKKRGTALAAASLVLVIAATAAAQEPDPRSTARLRLGPVAIAPTVTLRDLGVDTNVYNEGVSEPVKDFAFTVVPAFTAIVGPRNASFTLRSVTDLVYFARQTSERSVNQDLAASARVTLNRISPFAEAAYLNTRQRVWQEIDARARHVQRRGAAGVGIAVTPKIGLDFRGELWRMAFDGDATFDDHDLAEELNREMRTLSGTLRYMATPLTSILFSSEVATTRFTRAAFRDTDTRQFQAGLELHPRALVSGTVRVGYQRFRPRSSQVPEFAGFTGGGSVSYRLRGATTFGFLFNRSIDFSYLHEEPYYVREGYGVSVRRQVSARWDVEVSGERSRHGYRRLATATDGRTEGHVDRLLSAGVTVGHDLGPSTRVTTGLSYVDRSSDFSDRQFDGVRVGTSIVYGF